MRAPIRSARGPARAAGRFLRRLPGALAAVVIVGGALAAPSPADPASPSAPTVPLDQSAVLGRVIPGLVDISTVLGYQGAVGAGAGIVIDPSGEVLTNNHVIEGATEISAVSLATSQSYPIDVIGFDRASDIALIRLRGAPPLPTASVGTSSTIAVGDPIAAVGNSDGGDGNPSYAPGVITQLGASVRAADESGGSRELFDLIRVAADIRPGDSGGPLVNSSGQVIGINVAATLTYRMSGVTGGEGFAIPIDRAMAIANQIRAGAPSPSIHIGDTAFIGVGVADRLPFAPGPPGAVVRQVLPNTPAVATGLVSGDVITAVDGIPVTAAADLTAIMDQRRPGDVITLAWTDRAGNPRSAPLVLTKGPVG